MTSIHWCKACPRLGHTLLGYEASGGRFALCWAFTFSGATGGAVMRALILRVPLCACMLMPTVDAATTLEGIRRAQARGATSAAARASAGKHGTSSATSSGAAQVIALVFPPYTP